MVVLGSQFEKIQINPDKFLDIKWNLGFQSWEIPYDEPLSQKARKKLAAILSEKLNDRLKLFFKGKKQGTFKNTIILLKYLLKDLEYPHDFPHIFKKIRLNQLEEDLVFYRRCGRPKKSENKIEIPQKDRRKIHRNWEKSHSEKIPYQSTLINLFNKLVEEEILIKTPEIETTDRSKPNKKKPNTYYSINPEIFRLTINTAESKAKPDNLVKISKEMLIAKYRELQKENNDLKKYYNDYLIPLTKNQKDLFAAKEILKEHGVSQPDEAISSWLKSNKLWVGS